MNREILFRGKRVDNGEWHKGYYLYSEKENKHYIVDERITTTLDGILVPNESGFIKKEIIPQTIGQYTGLKDKNGKKIFEGDIVKNNWNDIYEKSIGSIWEVKFGEYDNSDIEYGSGGNIGFYVSDIRTKEMEGLNNLPCNYNDGIEVIGNIYEGDTND